MDAPSTPPTPAAPHPARDGEPSDKEADPTSLVHPVTRKQLGRVIAAEGLEIQTRRPDFTRLTRLMAMPRDPVLEISFDRAGRVATLRFVRRSGYQDVDEPVQNAVYGWRATGKALEDLPQDDPEAVVKIRVKIVLR